jgi:hypothetical protein
MTKFRPLAGGEDVIKGQFFNMLQRNQVAQKESLSAATRNPDETPAENA